MKINIKELVEKIVLEEIKLINETHDRGEWWIYNDGNIIFCDNNSSDQGHETVVIYHVVSEILSHFGIDVDEPDLLQYYEDDIKNILMTNNRLSEEELLGWDNDVNSKFKGPADIIINKLMEDKLYPTLEQTQDAVFVAYNSSKDARDYGMKYLRWKIMKTFGNHIEIQTWTLTSSDLKIIVRGIWNIILPDDYDESEVEDVSRAPLINITVQSSGKLFKDVPLEILEKQLPNKLHSYKSGVQVGYNECINEDKSYYYNHKDYRLYEGSNHIIAIFEDNSRLAFKVHYKNNRGEDRLKCRRKAYSKWKSIANEIYNNNKELNEVGNEVTKPWKECFKEALKDPRLQEFIFKKSYNKIYPDNSTIDPVNFSFVA